MSLCAHTIVCCLFVGQALVEAGESYKQLSEIKYSLEDSTKQNFIEPLHHLQSKDLKEVNVSRSRVWGLGTACSHPLWPWTALAHQAYHLMPSHDKYTQILMAFYSDYFCHLQTFHHIIVCSSTTVRNCPGADWIMIANGGNKAKVCTARLTVWHFSSLFLCIYRHFTD